MLIIAPMYSATNKAKLSRPYRLLADSNFHVLVNKYWHELKSQQAALVVPINAEDLAEVHRRFGFSTLQVGYGYNPQQTRTYWPGFSQLADMLSPEFELVLGVSLKPCQLQMLQQTGARLNTYAMHVSTQAGLEQPVDVWQNQEVLTASAFEQCYVHDQAQLDWLTSHRQLVGKAYVSDKAEFFKQAYYDSFELDYGFLEHLPVPFDRTIWTINRMSDPEYDNAKFVAYAKELGLLACTTNPTNCTVSEIMHVPMTKAQYYSFLGLKPNIWYRPAKTVWHVGKIELERFGVKIHA